MSPINVIVGNLQHSITGILEICLINIKPRVDCKAWNDRLGIMKTMMTSSNGNILRVTGLCVGNSLVTGEFPSQRPVTWSFDVFFDLLLNKRLCKQTRRRWLETSSRSLWRNCSAKWINKYLLGRFIDRSFVDQFPLRLKFGFRETKNSVLIAEWK